MRILSPEELERTDIFLREIVCLRQFWTSSTVYPYLSCPRKKSGFVIFTAPGAVYTLRDGSVLRPEAGELLYLPDRSFYRVSYSRPEGESYLLVCGIYDQGGEELVLSGEPAIFPVRNGPLLLESLRRLAKEYQSSVGNRLRLTSMTYAFFHEMITGLSAERSALQAALDEIHHNLYTSHSIAGLAASCFMSECTFRRKFKALTGLAPMEYIQKMKIEKAAQMLRESDCSTEEIVLALNFYDNAHFCRVFKAHMGCTPIQYRMKSTAE